MLSNVNLSLIRTAYCATCKAGFTLTEKRKAEKWKPIRTRGKTEADNVSLTTIASSNWLPLFRQSVNPA